MTACQHGRWCAVEHEFVDFVVASTPDLQSFRAQLAAKVRCATIRLEAYRELERAIVHVLSGNKEHLSYTQSDSFSNPLDCSPK